MNNQLQNSAGEPFSVEFLIDQEAFQRVILPYVENLKKLGINAIVRVVELDGAEEARG